METLSALLVICAGNSPVPGEIPAQRPVTRSFDVFFDLHLNKWLSKQSQGWWFETQSCSIWRHGNVTPKFPNHPGMQTRKHIMKQSSFFTFMLLVPWWKILRLPDIKSPNKVDLKYPCLNFVTTELCFIFVLKYTSIQKSQIVGTQTMFLEFRRPLGLRTFFCRHEYASVYIS